MNPEKPSRPALREELSGNAPAPQAAQLAVKKLPVSEPEIRVLRHHDTCPGIRNGGECACAANLELVRDGAFKALEKKTAKWMEPTMLPFTPTEDEILVLVEQHGEAAVRPGPEGTVLLKGEVMKRRGLVEVVAELWRVDDGKDKVVQRPAPSGSRTAPPITLTLRLEPRWICTRCGWGGRGKDISHHCDLTAVALSTRVATLADGLSEAEKRSGSLRLVIWKDSDDTYHLAEELVVDGKVMKTVERDKDGAYGVLEGALLSAVVDLWS